MKIFFWTMIAVVAGIFLYSQITKKKPLRAAGGKDQDFGKWFNSMFGPGIVDPITGAELAADARPGTVEFPAQNN